MAVVGVVIAKGFIIVSVLSVLLVFCYDHLNCDCLCVVHNYDDIMLVIVVGCILSCYVIMLYYVIYIVYYVILYYNIL